LLDIFQGQKATAPGRARQLPRRARRAAAISACSGAASGPLAENLWALHCMITRPHAPSAKKKALCCYFPTNVTMM
jgi:hypothetical protein